MRERLELLGESGAFYKLVESLRQAEEAATELGVRLSDGRWGIVAASMQKARMQVTELRNRRTA